MDREGGVWAGAKAIHLRHDPILTTRCRHKTMTDNDVVARECSHYAAVGHAHDDGTVLLLRQQPDSREPEGAVATSCATRHVQWPAVAPVHVHAVCSICHCALFARTRRLYATVLNAMTLALG